MNDNIKKEYKVLFTADAFGLNDDETPRTEIRGEWFNLYVWAYNREEALARAAELLESPRVVLTYTEINDVEQV